jgi:hypothetical protein
MMSSMVVEAVAQDGDAHGDGDGCEQEAIHEPGLFHPGKGGNRRHNPAIGEEPGADHRSGACEPLYLLALFAPRPAKADHEARRRGEEYPEVPHREQGIERAEDRP